jgi:hypothetical protein
LTQLERADLFARIARLRRLMPRNGEVMALCDVTERLVTNSPVTPVTSVTPVTQASERAMMAAERMRAMRQRRREAAQKALEAAQKPIR